MSSLYDELLAPEREPEGEPSPYEEIQVGDLAPSLTPPPPAPPRAGLREVQHRPGMRWLLDKFEDGAWALGLAAQGLRVGQDVLFAWTQGEHKTDPKRFQARFERGKTVFDVFRKSAILKGIEQVEEIEDPVARARILETLKQEYDIQDPTDLMTKPKLRQELAELEYGLQKAPPFLSAAEMLFGNKQPMLEMLPFLQATIPFLKDTSGFAALTFSVAKELRKEPTEVTAGDVATHVLDEGFRNWAKLTSPIVREMPVLAIGPGGEVYGTREFLQVNLPAAVGAVLLEPVELFYDPLFGLAETGVAAKGATVAVKGVMAVTKGVGAAAREVSKDLTRIAERAIRGPEPTVPFARHLVSIAEVPPARVSAIERTIPMIREAELPVDSRIGGVIEDLGLTDLKDPEALGREVALRTLPPGASKELLKFGPQGPIFQQKSGWGGGPPRQLELPIWPTPITDPARLLTASTGFDPGPDITLFGRNFMSPRWILYDDPSDGIARSIYLTQRRSSFDAVRMAGLHAEAFRGLNDLLKKAGIKGYTSLSKRLFGAINARPGKELAQKLGALSKEERRIAITTRGFIETYLRGHGAAATERRGLLEQAGFAVWPEEEFLITGKSGAARRGAFPLELADVPVADNIIFRHLYPGMKPSEDIVSAVRALSSGMIRNDLLKPAWKEMQKAAKNLPPRKRGFVRLWLANLQGVPSRFSQTFDELTSAVKADTKTPLYTSPVTELSSFVLSGYYRGLLFGNMNTFFSNFFGQGLANQAAKNGVFKTLYALGRHWKYASDGVPKEAFMGGFEALFAKEVPKSTFGLKLRQLPGIRQFRDFWNDVAEPQMGMMGNEFTNRFWGMKLGLGNALDNYNLRNKTRFTWDDAVEGRVPSLVKDGLMFEAMMHSDQVNHLWGVAGGNPVLRHYFGQTIIAHATQLLNWFPKQSEFLFGPLVKRGDPGILTNYMLFTGWLSNLAAKAWGIDFNRSAYWGSVPSVQGIGAPFPAGPSVDALWTLFSAIHEEVEGDPNQAKRYWEELSRHLEQITVPGVSAREKAEVFWKSLETGGLFTPTHLFAEAFGVERPRELMAFTGPTAAEQQGPIFGRAGGFDPNPENLERNIINILRSETPARALGLPTVSDRQRRRIETEIRRMNKVWTSLMSDLVNALVIEIQEGRKDGPRYQALIQAAEELVAVL